MFRRFHLRLMTLGPFGTQRVDPRGQFLSLSFRAGSFKFVERQTHADSGSKLTLATGARYIQVKRLSAIG
jgi:hypothetical protein